MSNHTINTRGGAHYSLHPHTNVGSPNHIIRVALFTCLLILSASISYAQGAPRQLLHDSSRVVVRSNIYNTSAGVNAPQKVAFDDAGNVALDLAGDTIYTAASKDSYGNAQGQQYDLAPDGAFQGQTVLVLHLYTGEGFDFENPRKALEEKGFSVVRYKNNPPSPEQLKKDLDRACQLWIISDATSKLNDEHISMIKTYFDRGYGVYIWGDNSPYYADANKVAEALFGGSMEGNLYGDQPVGIQSGELSPGIREGHDVTTGLETVYEGITIATLAEQSNLTPLVYGSAGNLISAAYEKDGKRAILDGGFTRLYIKWETAGTDRFVKNAAAWLVNIDNFELSYPELSDAE
ncbi:MAG: hypothetical protein KDD67_08475 [Ignavibacteriae bacterium]|nr:hypothetical protein [Ignavibacteriota bacterium]MCB9216702.1 hypothetical protein [Ignavibacteria bacterium]